MLGVYIGVFWPAESIPGVYFTLWWLVFVIMGKNPFFWTHGGSKYHGFKVLNYVNLGVYLGVFWPAESILGVYFTLGWSVFEKTGQKSFWVPPECPKIQLSPSVLCTEHVLYTGRWEKIISFFAPSFLILLYSYSKIIRIYDQLSLI